jgi:hypothetical protein
LDPDAMVTSCAALPGSFHEETDPNAAFPCRAGCCGGAGHRLSDGKAGPWAPLRDKVALDGKATLGELLLLNLPPWTPLLLDHPAVE